MKKKKIRRDTTAADRQARLTVVLEATRKNEFDEACRELGSNASEVLRHLIVGYVRSTRGAAPTGTTPPTTDSGDDRG